MMSGEGLGASVAGIPELSEDIMLVYVGVVLVVSGLGDMCVC
jgi:hypothetical protein